MFATDESGYTSFSALHISQLHFVVCGVYGMFLRLQ